MKYLFIFVACLMLIVLFLSACVGRKPVEYRLKDGRELQGKMKVAREPDKRVTWEITAGEGVNLEIKVLVEGQELYRSSKLKDEFKLGVSNTEFTVKVINKSGKDITFDGIFHYLYIGMAPYAVTVTKEIKLN